MSYLKDFQAELRNDEFRKIVFTCTGAIDFIENIEIELSKTPKEGFTETHPCKLFHEMYIRHLYLVLCRNFLLTISYCHHPCDERLYPDDKIYYKCTNYYHHSHDFFNKHERKKIMTIKEAMKYVKENHFDLEIVEGEWNNIRRYLGK
jgi:hypothetical protein